MRISRAVGAQAPPGRPPGYRFRVKGAVPVEPPLAPASDDQQEREAMVARDCFRV
jgi:hypothetical protein